MTSKAAKRSHAGDPDWVLEGADQRESATNDNKRFHIYYRPNDVNYCPGCGRTHWYVSRYEAECAFCTTTLAVENARRTGSAESLPRVRFARRMSPEEKASLEARAARLGVSSAEYKRLAVSNIESLAQRAELVELTEELEASIPDMRRDFAAIRESLASARSAIARYQREKAVVA